jgi:hypothetical protein
VASCQECRKLSRCGMARLLGLGGVARFRMFTHFKAVLAWLVVGCCGLLVWG